MFKDYLNCFAFFAAAHFGSMSIPSSSPAAASIVGIVSGFLQQCRSFLRLDDIDSARHTWARRG